MSASLPLPFYYPFLMTMNYPLVTQCPTSLPFYYMTMNYPKAFKTIIRRHLRIKLAHDKNRWKISRQYIKVSTMWKQIMPTHRLLFLIRDDWYIYSMPKQIWRVAPILKPVSFALAYCMYYLIEAANILVPYVEQILCAFKIVCCCHCICQANQSSIFLIDFFLVTIETFGLLC